MDPLTVGLSILQLIREAQAAYNDFQKAQLKAQAEKRELTDAELDQFKLDTIAARARLTATKRPGE